MSFIMIKMISIFSIFNLLSLLAPAEMAPPVTTGVILTTILLQMNVLH